MAYKDDLATAQVRLQANAPQLATTGRAVTLALLQPFLGRFSDLENLISDKDSARQVATATGSDLDALGAQVGVTRPAGAPASIVAAGGAGIIFSITNAVASTTDIPAGTTISTAGNGVTTQGVSFYAAADTSIPAGSTTAPAVGGTATVSGSAGNVATGTLTSVLSATGLLVTNTLAATGGTDSADDPTYRSAITAAQVARYGKAAVQAAITAIAGVYDAYVYDPQDGNGSIPYMWATSAGTTPGLTGTTAGSLTVSGTVAANTLAATVDAAVLGVLPPRNTPIRSAFTIINLTAINVSYSAPSTYSSSVLQPQIAAAIVAYIQSLTHGQTPTAFGMGQAVQQALGFILVSFTLNSSTPTISTASATTLYRCTGGPSVVSFT